MLLDKVPVLSMFLNYAYARVLLTSACPLVALSPLGHKRGSKGRGKPGNQSVVRCCV